MYCVLELEHRGAETVVVRSDACALFHSAESLHDRDFKCISLRGTWVGHQQICSDDGRRSQEESQRPRCCGITQQCGEGIDSQPQGQQAQHRLNA